MNSERRRGSDLPTLMAAILHDTVEDTGSTFAELEETFGREVRLLVEEVTDDKSLPKEVRKQLQIDHAQALSSGAKQIKIADKICNIHDVAHTPPPQWPLERRREYLQWAAKVVDGCRGRIAAWSIILTRSSGSMVEAGEFPGNHSNALKEQNYSYAEAASSGHLRLGMKLVKERRLG